MPTNTSASSHLIDLSGLFFRYYFGLGPDIFNEDGWDVGAILGCTRWLLNQPDLLTASHVVLAFDESLGSGFRHDIDEDYKANRAMPTEDIIYQMECMKHVGEYLGFHCVASERLEADDLIAGAAKQLKGHRVLIHTRDKDLRQLLAPNVEIRDFISEQVWTHKSFMDEEGIKPDQVALFLALVGDSSDNIAGVPRVGAKTAKTLIQHYGDWESILAAAQSGDTLPVRGERAICEKLLEFSDLIPHNLSLTQLYIDPDMDIIPIRAEADWDELQAFIDVIGLGKALTRTLDRVRS